MSNGHSSANSRQSTVILYITDNMGKNQGVNYIFTMIYLYIGCYENWDVGFY